MKALTLWQPWASLVALGAKTIETRSWSTRYRGPLAIHASAAVPTSVVAAGRRVTIGAYEVERDNPRGTAPAYLLRGSTLSWPYRLPLGEIVATCRLVDVVPVEGLCWTAAQPHWRHLLVMDDDDQESPFAGNAQRPYGDFTPGRFAWLLDSIKALHQPIPARGRQGLWEWHGPDRVPDRLLHEPV